MATTHGTSTDDRPQGTLLDDSDFLRTMVERTPQGLLDAEMTTHLPRGRPVPSPTSGTTPEPVTATDTSPEHCTPGWGR